MKQSGKENNFTLFINLWKYIWLKKNFCFFCTILTIKHPLNNNKKTNFYYKIPFIYGSRSRCPHASGLFRIEAKWILTLLLSLQYNLFEISGGAHELSLVSNQPTYNFYWFIQLSIICSTLNKGSFSFIIVSFFHTFTFGSYWHSFDV